MPLYAKNGKEEIAHHARSATQKEQCAGASVGPDEYDFVPPVLRERIDPVRGIAGMEVHRGDQGGRVSRRTAKVFAELGAEIKRLKA